jgi:DHA3 family macrolide efflux protein-like MFS transporter
VRVLQPLSNPAIARLWAAIGLATIGDELFRLALVWLAVEAIGENAAYVTALQAAATLCGAAFGGRFFDRIDPPRVMMWACMGRTFFALVPVAFYLAGFPLLAGLAIAAFALAILRGQFEPAMYAAVPRVADDAQQRLQTNGLIDSTIRLARIIGPAMAGPLAVAIPIVHFFTLHSVMLAGAVLALAGLAARGARMPESGGLHGLAAGFGYARAHPVIRPLLLVALIYWGSWVMALSLGLALIVHERQPTAFGIPAVSSFSALFAIYALGTVASNLWLIARDRVPEARLVALGHAVVGIGFTAIGAAGHWAPDAWLLPALALAVLVTALGTPALELRLAYEIQSAGSPAAVSAVARVRLVAGWSSILAIALVGPSLVRLVAIGPTVMITGLATIACAFWISVQLAERALGGDGRGRA